MDNATEDFWLQASTDGGATFTTIEEWNLNDEFVNGQRYNESVEIQQAFSNETQFRFRCDASSNYDYVFLDDLTISTCKLNAKINSEAVEDSLLDIDTAKSLKVTFAPNPASSVARVDFSLSTATKVQLHLYDLSGKLSKQLLDGKLLNSGQHNLTLSVNDLPNGTYLLFLQTPYASSQQKIIIAK